jgi:hypothetical protein
MKKQGIQEPFTVIPRRKKVQLLRFLATWESGAYGRPE